MMLIKFNDKTIKKMYKIRYEYDSDATITHDIFRIEYAASL